MTDIRYVFGVLKTGEVVEEISLQGVSMSSKLNDWGTFGGTFALDQSGKKNIDLVGATTPGLCYVCCERDDIPVWFGIVWGRTYQSQSKTIQINARELGGYAEKRRVMRGGGLNYVQEDQGDIFLDLWDIMQNTSSYGSIGVNPPGSFTTGVLKDLQVQQQDYKTFFDVMSSLADADDGFDWTVSTTKDAGGAYVHDLLVGYPTLGQPDPALLSFEYPGNIINYYETMGMTEAGTRIIMVGASTGDDPALSIQQQHDDMHAGLWVEYDQVVTRKDVSDFWLLVGLGIQQKGLRRPPMRSIKAFTKADADPEFSSYSLGDSCRLILQDAAHEDPINVDTRITAWTYRPASNDTTDEVELIFEGDELND